jgi:hypothetical protein
MKAIQIISQDLFDKVRSRFTNLEMGDETGAVTIDPAEARFFDFDFVSEGINLGRISINLNDVGSLKIYYSQGITEDQDDLAKRVWYDFLKEMRMFAMRRLLRFDTRDIAKDNLDRNDFQYLATKGPKEETMTPNTMNESRWMLEKSTKKTSRAVKGRTQVIVRHTESMSERRIGDRSNPKRIKAIYIENAEGERFKYPFIHPAGAFAMAQHVDHGGIPHDPAGKAIIKMSEQIAQLQQFRKQVQHSTLNDDATGITERAIGRLQELKARVESLGKRQYYETWVNEFNEVEQNDEMLSELDPVTFEEYKSKFTSSSFNEELGKLFPLIHSIMQEKIDLEDYVKEETTDELDETDDVKEDLFNEFEEWAEATEQGKLTDDQIEDIKQAFTDLQSTNQELELGPNGETAWQFFNGLGIEDTDLQDKLKLAADEFPESDPVEVFQTWAQESYPELLVTLGMSMPATQPEPAPEQPASAPPAPEQPAPEQPVAESKQESMISEIAKLVKSRFNESNPNVGPFNGHEGILIDVEKTIAEKFGDKAGKQARTIAEKFMEKLTHKWQQRHGEQVMGETDDIQRLKELLGNVKAKVEGMSANTKEHNDTFDPKSHAYKTTMKHADNPTVQQRMAAHDIQPGVKGYRDRIDMLRDLERTGKLKPETDEGMMDKVKSFGKKVLDKVAPDDATLLKKLEKDSGGRIPPQFEPKIKGSMEEGSGPKEKQHSKYVDRNSPESKAKVQAAKDKMASDARAEPGKKLADKIAKKDNVAESEMAAILKLAGMAK